MPYDGEQKAREDVRTGKLDDAVLSPGSIRAACSRRTLGIGLVVDSTDQTMSNGIAAEMQSLVDALTAPVFAAVILLMATPLFMRSL